MDVMDVEGFAFFHLLNKTFLPIRLSLDCGAEIFCCASPNKASIKLEKVLWKDGGKK